MTYTYDSEQFEANFAVKTSADGSKSLTHHTGHRFLLFPFVTSNKRESIVSLQSLVGHYLCQIAGTKEQKVVFEEVKDRLLEKITIEDDCQEDFERIIKTLFFQKEGELKPLNLSMINHLVCPSYCEGLANYLADVLTDKTKSKDVLSRVNNKFEGHGNVLENLLCEEFCPNSPLNETRQEYFRVRDCFDQVFAEDLEFILNSSIRTREFLVDFLEFYYFTYTAQVCLQLNRFEQAERDKCVPLYFALDWERTSKGRRCYDEGWNRIHPIIERMFSHAVVLELLNQTKETTKHDYLTLAQYCSDNPGVEPLVAREIRRLTEDYRDCVRCDAVDQIPVPNLNEPSVAQEINYLFKVVEAQFMNSSRKRAYTGYSSKFIDFCKKHYVRSKGSVGSLLILSEANLILLTKLAIKNQKKLRLSAVFNEFEKRGVFLDVKSKTAVMEYFEKLNIIEKKSDSGDAQYVKRIL